MVVISPKFVMQMRHYEYVVQVCLILAAAIVDLNRRLEK